MFTSQRKRFLNLAIISVLVVSCAEASAAEAPIALAPVGVTINTNTPPPTPRVSPTLRPPTQAPTRTLVPTLRPTNTLAPIGRPPARPAVQAAAPTSTFTSVPQAARSGTIREIDVPSDVLSKLNTGASESSASLGQTITVGGTVRTLDRGKARIDLNEGTVVRVAPKTLFTVTSLTQDTLNPFTRLQLAFGKVFIILSGGRMEVETPVGSASVRGSFMSVEFNEALRQLTINCLETLFNCDLSYQGTIFNLLTLQKIIVPAFPPRIQQMDGVDIKEWLINVPNSPTVIPPTATNPAPAPQPPAPAATATNTPVPSIVVNTLTDELNSDGDCSLREAIKAANTNVQVDQCKPVGGSDTITFSVNGTILMTGSATDRGDDAGLIGDYDITESLTVIGNGSANTIISGNSVDRVFHILAGTVSLSEMTISNGNPGAASGGGVFVGAGAAALSNVVVSNNTATEGGGVRVSAATMTISGSTINSNTATNNGGGIYNIGTLTMSGSTITGNTADSDSNGSGNGGGLWNNSSATLTSSTVSSNSAQDGGGITNDSSLTLTSVTLSNNNAKNNGGGVISVNTMSITNSTISGNTANSDNTGGGDGGGIYVGTSGSLTVSGGTIGGTGVGNKANLGGGIYATVTSTLTGVLIEDNTATGGGGGGIQTAGGTTTIQNTTIKKNKGFDAGGGIHVATGGTVSISKSAIDQNTLTSTLGGVGGGVYNENVFDAKETSITANTSPVGTSGGLHNSTGTSTLKNVTVSSNSSSSFGGGIYIVGGIVETNNVTIAYNTSGTGGGLYTQNTGTPKIGNTIFSNNTATTDPDCSQQAGGTFTDKDHNLIATATTCGFAVANNITGSSANLVALAGTTPAYHALNAGSPAIDKGDPFGSTTQACETNDTRGVTRSGPDLCDIGAYESN